MTDLAPMRVVHLHGTTAKIHRSHIRTIEPNAKANKNRPDARNARPNDISKKQQPMLLTNLNGKPPQNSAKIMVGNFKSLLKSI